MAADKRAVSRSFRAVVLWPRHCETVMIAVTAANSVRSDTPNDVSDDTSPGTPGRNV
jgi:hypothetical protein